MPPSPDQVPPSFFRCARHTDLPQRQSAARTCHQNACVAAPIGTPSRFLTADLKEVWWHEVSVEMKMHKARCVRGVLAPAGLAGRVMMTAARCGGFETPVYKAPPAAFSGRL